MNTFQDYKKIFDVLKKRGYSRFFVEAGLTFLNFLMDQKIVNNLYIFKTNYKLKNNGKNYSSNSILKKIVLKKNSRIKVNLFGDKLYKVALK